MTNRTKLAPSSLTPILNWAGGKRWLAKTHPELFCGIKGRYIEPFLGSGAVFFAIDPDEAILSDVNPGLMNVYAALQSDHTNVVRSLRKHARFHCEDYYYSVRSSSCRTSASQAARFIYLNRTCWNGLYRVNKKGEFNVPIGSKPDALRDTDDFASISDALQGVTLRCGDFAATIAQANKGDLVYCDPPYTVNHDLNGFLNYNEKLFSWKDQERLHAAVLAAANRGARIVVSQAQHASIRALYERDFCLEVVARYSGISGSNKGRKMGQELVITRGF